MGRNRNITKMSKWPRSTNESITCHKMEINTTKRYQYTPIRTARI